MRVIPLKVHWYANGLQYFSQQYLMHNNLLLNTKRFSTFWHYNTDHWVPKQKLWKLHPCTTIDISFLIFFWKTPVHPIHLGTNRRRLALPLLFPRNTKKIDCMMFVYISIYFYAYVQFVGIDYLKCLLFVEWRYTLQMKVDQSDKLKIHRWQTLRIVFSIHDVQGKLSIEIMTCTLLVINLGT